MWIVAYAVAYDELSLYLAYVILIPKSKSGDLLCTQVLNRSFKMGEWWGCFIE